MHPLTPVFIALALVAPLGCGGGGGGNSPASANPTPVPPAQGVGPASCVGGTADGFACRGISLDKHVTLAQLGGSSGNDIWGWVDAATGNEYALVGLDNGTAFVDVTAPANPIVIGRLPTQTTRSPWRDVKVYADHAYIVADGAGFHGMQVFDLTRLRSGGTGQTFAADVVYGDFGSAHNVAINEASGYAYVVGSDTCAGGLHMVDLATPISPQFAGCHTTNGETHDTQCVNYAGPDADHAGTELCFNSNEDRVLIVDVTDKSSTVALSALVYPDLGFVHQAWLTTDHRYLMVGDELDEQQLGVTTGSVVIDVTDVDAPVHLYTHRAATQSTDHNLHVIGSRVYQANYTSGLRILEFTDLATDTLTEVAFFDTHPESNAPSFDGAWSVYPSFPSGTLIVNDTQRGLFVLSE